MRFMSNYDHELGLNNLANPNMKVPGTSTIFLPMLDYYRMMCYQVAMAE